MLNILPVSAAGIGRFRFESDDTFSYQFRSGREIRTNRKFRDTSAWYHLVAAVDTTQGTSSNRCKIYLNGVQLTDFATETYPCNLNDGKSSEDLMAVAQKYDNWVAENGTAEAYFYGIYEALDDDAMFDFLWLNFHQSFDGLEAGNANFAEKGGDMQASFDEVASCRAPDLYDSYEFRNLMSEAS